MRRNTVCPPHRTLCVALLALVGACAANPTPPCASSTDCAEDDVCYRGFCIAGQPMMPDSGPPRDAAITCPPGQTVCDARCFNLLNDHDHCGSCITSCHGMMGTCAFGRCVSN